jgi:hypothetical protein
MPPKSKAQMRFFGAVAGGKAKGSGLSKKQAKEALKGSKAKGLPARTKKKGKKRK